MKALLLTFMFFISITAFSQQKLSKEDGAALKESSIVFNDSSAVASKDSLISSQSIIIDHNALAKRYKRKSTNYGIAAAVFGGALIGCSKYCYDHFSCSETAYVAYFGVVCLGAAIGCTIASVVYHYKAGKELKLSVKGTTASLVYTF